MGLSQIHSMKTEPYTKTGDVGENCRQAFSPLGLIILFPNEVSWPECPTRDEPLERRCPPQSNVRLTSKPPVWAICTLFTIYCGFRSSYSFYWRWLVQDCGNSTFFISSLKHKMQCSKNSPGAESTGGWGCWPCMGRSLLPLLESHITTLGRCIGVQS